MQAGRQWTIAGLAFAAMMVLGTPVEAASSRRTQAIPSVVIKVMRKGRSEEMHLRLRSGDTASRVVPPAKPTPLVLGAESRSVELLGIEVAYRNDVEHGFRFRIPALELNGTIRLADGRIVDEFTNR